jgi:hypothetical protein
MAPLVFALLNLQASFNPKIFTAGQGGCKVKAKKKKK